MASVSSLQVPPPGRREAGPLHGRQRLGGRHRQEEELHGRGATQPGRPGETRRQGGREGGVHPRWVTIHWGVGLRSDGAQTQGVPEHNHVKEALLRGVSMETVWRLVHPLLCAVLNRMTSVG